MTIYYRTIEQNILSLGETPCTLRVPPLPPHTCARTAASSFSLFQQHRSPLPPWLHLKYFSKKSRLVVEKGNQTPSTRPTIKLSVNGTHDSPSFAVHRHSGHLIQNLSYCGNYRVSYVEKITLSVTRTAVKCVWTR